jgi:hypothetical protein
VKDPFARQGHPETDDALASLEAAHVALRNAERALRTALYNEEADAMFGFSYAIARVAETLHDRR